MDRTGGRAEFLRNGPSSKIRLYSGINAPATSLQGQFYPVRFEVIRNALLAITEEMGATLRRAAYSTKIKTRADFSCAFFDADLRAIARPSPSRPRQTRNPGKWVAFVAAALRNMPVADVWPPKGGLRLPREVRPGMGCTICGAQFACSFHNRAECVIGVQFVVGSIPHAGVLEDQVVRGADGSNAIAFSFSCRAPNRVGFNPVPITPVNGDSTVHISLDAVFLKGISVTLALRSNKINSPARIVANRAISHGVSIALAGGAIKKDANVAILADGTVGYNVPPALTLIAGKLDTLSFIPADGAIGNPLSIALPGEAAIKIDAVAPIPADGAFANRVSATLALIVAAKKDAHFPIVADGTIRNCVPAALAFYALKKDATVCIPADGTVGDGVPIARGVQAPKINALFSVPGDGAI